MCVLALHDRKVRGRGNPPPIFFIQLLQICLRFEKKEAYYLHVFSKITIFAPKSDFEVNNYLLIVIC